MILHPQVKTSSPKRRIRRAPGETQTSITLPAEMLEWGKTEARRLGIHNFSAYIRTLMVKDRDTTKKP